MKKFCIESDKKIIIFLSEKTGKYDIFSDFFFDFIFLY